MSVSVFNHPYLAGLLGNDSVSRYFDAEMDIQAMLSFEAALAEAQGVTGAIPIAAVAPIKTACLELVPEMDRLKSGTANDGVVVPELVRQLKISVSDEHKAYVHFGATSQDVIDTSLMLRLRSCIEIIEETLERVVVQIEQLNEKFGDRQLMGRTRMQQALPITVSHRLANWRTPLTKQLEKLESVKVALLNVQFGGPIGTLDNFQEAGPKIRSKMSELLGLGDPGGCWHTDRTSIVDFANWLSVLTGVIGKIGKDITLMSINEVKEISLRGGGGSSAMPHKQNPIKAEMLVTLGQFNAMNMSGMHQVLSHENERSGQSWTLEWMLLPQMVMTTSASLRLAEELLNKIERIGDDNLN